METHTGFWNLINLYYDEYDHINGMQKYFDYCIENQITCDLLETLFHEEIPDIYEYKYSNEEVMQRLAENLMNCYQPMLMMHDKKTS